MTRDNPIRWRHVGDRYLATCIRGGRLLRAYSTRGWRVAVAMLEKRANDQAHRPAKAGEMD